MALAALATAAIPGLDVVATREPQRTVDDVQSAGVLDSSGRRWVVRCPVDSAAGAALEAEHALLENLTLAVADGSLPFAVPRTEGVAPLPEGGRAFLHRQLRGRPLDLAALGPGPGLTADLARAIAALHELPESYVADAGLPVYTAGELRQRTLAVVDEAAATSRVPTSLLLRWEQALEDVALWRFQAVPVHGDLAEDHVLVLDAEVSAVLGFSSAHVGDPALDLAWLVAGAPAESLDTVLEAYALARPEHAVGRLHERALLHSEVALARWLLHGVHRQDSTIVDDATAMLDDLAAQIVDADPIGAQPPLLVPGRSPDWQSVSGHGEDADDLTPADGDEPWDPRDGRPELGPDATQPVPVVRDDGGTWEGRRRSSAATPQEDDPAEDTDRPGA